MLFKKKQKEFFLIYSLVRKLDWVFESKFPQIRLKKLQSEPFSASQNMTGPIRGRRCKLWAGFSCDESDEQQIEGTPNM